MVTRFGASNPNYRHGMVTGEGGKRHALYVARNNMLSRCYNPKNEKYHRYGGRGISVCDEWRTSPKAFFEWALGAGWREGLTIDRIDNDGNYNVENCQWVSKGKNSRKKSTTKLKLSDAQEIRFLHASGITMNALAEKFDVCHGTIWFIIENATHDPELE